MTSVPGLERRVDAVLQRARLSGTGATIVVACSGGPDSTALLTALNRLRSLHGLSLHVAHLNHDFRGAEADHDAAFVQLLADGLGLPCSIDKRDPIAYQRTSGVSSFEQAAREMRYSFLLSVATAVGASVVALGHTSDDQAETVLLHILRGSGLQGLRGMAEVSDWPWPADRPAPLLFRPLLSVSKSETAAYCQELGRTYREDSGNYLWRFTRNRVRLDLMPRLARDYNPRVRDALLRLSRTAVDEEDFLDIELGRAWDDIAVTGDGEVSLDVKALAALHPALQRRALRRAYASSAGDSRGPSESHLEAMLGLVRNRRGGRSISLPRGVRASVEGGVLRIASREGQGNAVLSPSISREIRVRVPRQPGEVAEGGVDGWQVILRAGGPLVFQADPVSPHHGFAAALKRDVLGETVTVRSRRPGDRFQPSGMTGTKKLQDFFTDAKVPREQRDSIPLLVCERGIAWVVGHRVAEWAKGDEDSESVRVEFLAREARWLARPQNSG